MKRLIVVLAVLLISCQSQEEKQMDNVGNSILKHIQDVNFKSNTDFLIHEFEVISIDTIDMITLDSLDYLRAKERNTAELKEIVDGGQGLIEEGELARLMTTMLGSNDPVAKVKMDEFKRKADDFTVSFNGKTKEMKELDSLFAIKVKAYVPKQVLEAKVYAKISFENKQDSWNVLDTLYYYLDQDYKIIVR